MVNRLKDFDYRQLNASDIDLVMDFQKKIYASLKDKDLLRLNDREQMKSSIGDAGSFAIGVFDNKNPNKLNAIAIMVDARGTSEDLSANLKKHRTKRPINLKSVMVSPEYRGLGLQRELMERLEKVAKERGYTHICTSVHPKNIYSMNNVISRGFEYDHTEAKYGGLERNILVKDTRVQ